MQVTGIDHINLGYPVDRLEEVIEFYTETLGFDISEEAERRARSDDPDLFSIDLGNGFALYVAPVEDFDADVGSYRHTALRVDLTPEELRARLDNADVKIRSTADRSRTEFGAYRSYYIQDPFGYTLELMAVGG